PRQPLLTAQAPGLPPALGRDDRLAPRRRNLPRRDRLGVVRPLERAGGPLDRRDRDDGADDPLPAPRRGRHRPARPPTGDALRRRGAGGGGGGADGPRAPRRAP